MIIVKNRELLIPNNERYIGTTYDDNSTVRTFRVPRFHEDGMDKSQLDFYVIINYDDGSDPDAVGVTKSVSDDYIVLEWDVNEDITEHSGCLFLWVRGFDYTGAIRWSSFPGVFYIEGSGTEPSDLSDLEQRISEEDKLIRLAKLYKSQPMTAATVADMKDRERIYVYVGNEPGYTYGNWYFWDGDAWVPGGVYNSVALQTDKELISSDVAADAKATGETVAQLKNALESRTDALDTALAAETTERKAEDDLRIPYAQVQTPIKAHLTKIFDGPHQDYIHQGFACDGEYYYFARYASDSDPVVLSKINMDTGVETSVTTSYVCHANNISIIDDKLYVTGNDNNLLMVYDKNLNFIKEIQTPDSVYAFDRSTSNSNVCVYGISGTESFALCVLTDGSLQVVGGITGTRIPATNKQGIYVGSYIYQLLSRYGNNPGHIRIITMFGIEYGDIVFDFDDTEIEFEDLTKIENVFYISDAKGNVYQTDDLTGKLSHLFTLSPFTPPNFGVTYSPIATKLTPSNGLCNATFYTSGNNYVLKSFVIPNQVINRTCFVPRVIFECNSNRVADGYIDVQYDKRLVTTIIYLTGNTLVIINARYLYNSTTGVFTFDESYFRAIVKKLADATVAPTVYTDVSTFVAAGNDITIRSFSVQSLYYHNIGIQTL